MGKIFKRNTYILFKAIQKIRGICSDAPNNINMHLKKFLIECIIVSALKKKLTL